jgi:hypothetical protein
MLLTTPDGESRSYNYEQEVLIDTKIHGKYQLTATANDFAGAFGKAYKDNYVKKQGYIIVRSGSVTVHFDSVDQSFVPEHITPTPAPAHHDIIADHHHLSIPPILVLSDADGSIITRSSPFGSHHDEGTYRAHLTHMGYSDDEVADHITAIVEREMHLAEKLGEEHAWSNYAQRRLRGIAA